MGVDRPGGDYLNFEVRPADPAICAARCEREARCRAWTFAYPTPENPSGICWLKSGVPPRVQAPCCISGIRGAGVIEPRGGPLEYSIDRFGGDYRNFDLQPDPTASACKAACEAELEMPRLDLSPPRLRRPGSPLFSEESGQGAATPPVLHFGRGEVIIRAFPVGARFIGQETVLRYSPIVSV